MTGGALLGLVLRSMGWLFFLGGPLPGVVGSLTVFFSLPALAKYGVVMPWPWVWILLPLALDPWLVLLLRRSK